MEEYFDNPAGRLYLLFRDLSQLENHPLVQCWAEVLNAELEDVPFRLGLVASLLSELRDSVEKGGSRPMKATVNRYREAWSRPIIPVDFRLSDRADKLLPDAVALEALDSVAEYLHLNRPEGRIPDSDSLGHLIDQLNQLTEDVGLSDLPEDLKNLILERISQVGLAITHIRLSGPGQVKAAVESLIGAIATSPGDDSSKRDALKKVWTFALAAMTCFSFGTDVAGVLEPSDVPVLEVVVESQEVDATAGGSGSENSAPKASKTPE